MYLILEFILDLAYKQAMMTSQYHQVLGQNKALY